MANSKNKRGSTSGFDGIRGEKTAQRIRSWEKNQPAGRWRKVCQVKVEYTYMRQTWYYLEKEYTRIQICPWGMKLFVQKLLEDEKVSNFQAIPLDVRENLNLVKDGFDAKDMKVTCKNDGNKGYGTFYMLFCEQCKKEKLPVLQG